MSASDVYFIIRNGKLIKVIENDGPRYLRRGAERYEEIVPYSKYKDDKRAELAVKEYEIVNNKKFDDGSFQ